MIWTGKMLGTLNLECTFPALCFHKFGVAIWKVLFYSHFMAEKLPKIQYGRHFLAIKQNFRNRYTTFVQCHTGKVHYKFQVPGMFVDQMNVPTFCELSVSRFKLLKVCTYCIYRWIPNFKKILIQSRNFSFVFFASFKSQWDL